MKNCPVPFTCPLIDSAIDDLDSISSQISTMIGRLGILEEIRSANEKLRSWGEELSEELEDSHQTITELENKIDELEAELERLKAN